VSTPHVSFTQLQVGRLGPVVEVPVVPLEPVAPLEPVDPPLVVDVVVDVEVEPPVPESAPESTNGAIPWLPHAARAADASAMTPRDRT
jgi:hypothetical protein